MSPRGDGFSSVSSLGDSLPSPCSSPEAYRIPLSLRKKRQRRYGSPQRRLWGGGGCVDRSPSPPADSLNFEKEWSDIRQLSVNQQMQAYWRLLYPDRDRVALEIEQAETPVVAMKSRYYRWTFRFPSCFMVCDFDFS
jgi:hypothetical protein